jgi:predicted alpha/beta-hydrolase family hydrolase
MKIKIDNNEAITAIAYKANKKMQHGITLLLGHGAGASQTSDFMVNFAKGLAARGIEVVTFNFLYTEQGRRAPDRQEKLEACYRVVIKVVQKTLNTNQLFIGGKSMGGRIASQIAATDNEGINGLVFLGYPLHPPGKPDALRAKHLSQIHRPMLFVQGERDTFGTPDELQPIVSKLTPACAIYPIPNGDHSFTVPKKSPISQQDVYAAAQDEIVKWLVVGSA